MVELVPVRASVIACLANASGVDAAISVWDGPALRVAPDEALLLAAERPRTAATSDAAKRADPDAVVVDATDGWAIWRLEGDVRDAFSRISHMPFPDVSAQGEVAQVPAKIVVDAGAIVVLVPAMWREAVRDRTLEDCRTLGIVERANAAKWSGDHAGPAG